LAKVHAGLADRHGSRWRCSWICDGRVLSAIFNVADVFSARGCWCERGGGGDFNLGFAMWAAESIVAAMVFRF